MKNDIFKELNNYLKIQKKRFFSLSNDEILMKIKFKFMKKLSELSENLEDIEIYELIQKIRNEENFKNIQYYSLINFKNIELKLLNMKIFYYQSNDNEYQLYLSFNLNNPRIFKNQRIQNISKKELNLIKNQYMIKESILKRQVKIS